MPCAAVTAWHALFTEGRLKPGETVLSLAREASRCLPCSSQGTGARVIVTSSSDEKLGRAKELGAHDGINYRDNPDWSSAGLALTDGRGADHVIEVGGPQSFAQSLKASSRGAQINVIGYLGGSEGAINPLDIFRRQVKARGIPVGSRESFEAMNRALAVNQLRPVIGRVFPWAEAAEAFRHLEHGSPFGKVVLDHNTVTLRVRAGGWPSARPAWSGRRSALAGNRPSPDR